MGAWRATAATNGWDVSLSIGVAVQADGVSVAKLVEAADAAMYASKRAGGDRATVADPGGAPDAA